MRDAAIVKLVSTAQTTNNPAGVAVWVSPVSDPQIKAGLEKTLAGYGQMMRWGWVLPQSA